MKLAQVEAIIAFKYFSGSLSRMRSEYFSTPHAMNEEGEVIIAFGARRARHVSDLSRMSGPIRHRKGWVVSCLLVRTQISDAL